MKKDDQPALVPKLRFPEFREAAGWEMKSIGQLGEVVTGSTPSTALPEYYGGDRLFVSPADISDGRFVEKTKTTLSALGFRQTRLVRANSILFSCIGTIGKIAQNRQECATNQQINSVVPHTNISDGFAYYALCMGVGKIADLAGKQTIPIVNKSLFSSVELAFPKLPEQQKIADCLSLLDELIAAQARKVDALKTHKKGLMQQLFPHKGETQPRLRFPEFRDAGAWTPTTLGSIASFSSGGTPSKDNAEYWNGSIPWVSASSMYELHVSKADHYVTPLAIGNGTRIAKTGTLLILVRGSMLFKRVPMCVAAVDVAFNQDVKALKVAPSVDSIFLIYQLMTNETLIPINETGIGAGKIELADLKEFGLFVPSQSEQRHIADCISNLDDLITAATQELETLKTHKKGLMQQLFPSTEAVEA